MVLTPTSEPFPTATQSFNGFSSGFGYASFLLGDYNSSAQTAQTDPRNHDMNWAFFAQDSWKVSRKLTLDYGLRWDLYGVETEQYGRLGQFSETLPNANAGGHPGATIYASNCNCSFYQPAYKFAFGPRIGAAYQLNSKTVLRGGWGLTYALVENLAGASVSTNGRSTLPVGINQFVNDSVPRLHPAAGLAHHRSEPLSRNRHHCPYARACRTTIKIGRRASISSASASSAKLLATSSWKPSTSATAPRGSPASSVVAS